MKQISVMITIGIGTKCVYLNTTQQKCAGLADIDSLFEKVRDKLPEANRLTSLALGEMGGRRDR